MDTGAPRVQDWQSKNLKLEGSMSYVVLELLINEKALNLSRQNTPKFTSLRSKTKKFSEEGTLPHPRPLP